MESLFVNQIQFMCRLTFICCLLFCITATAQNIAKDTILLDDVLIEKGVRKPKLKNIKIGRRSPAFTSSPISFAEYPVYFLADSLPEGYIEQIALFFFQSSLKNTGDSRFFKKVYKTEFEVTLYEVGDNYSVGKKVNEEPILIVLEESKQMRQKKVELNIIPYNFKASRFYIQVKKVIPITCDDCYYHIPVLYQTKDGNHFVAGIIKQAYAKSEPYCFNCLGMQMEIKTLTKEY